MQAGTPPNLIRAIEMGAEDFLLKPFTQKELKEKVENVFRPKKSPGFGVVNVLCVDDQQVILRIVRCVVVRCGGFYSVRSMALGGMGCCRTCVASCAHVVRGPLRAAAPRRGRVT